MAFRTFSHWPSSAPRARAKRVVTRLRCIGPLEPDDVAELLAMPHLRELVLEGIDAFPRELARLGELRSLTLNARGEDGVTSLPDDVRNLASLRTLRIRARRLTALPDAIFELRNLVELDVRHSGVTTLPPRTLELPNLRRIVVGQ